MFQLLEVKTKLNGLTMSNTITIPPTINDMRINHLPFLLKLREFGKVPPHKEICKMNASFTGVPYGQMKRYTQEANKNLFNEIVKSFDGYQQKPIPLSLEYEGVKFNFISDFTKLPYEWFIDESEVDFMENPIDLVSFCYIEDGMTYGEADEHQNVLNPRSVRSKIFEKNIPLNLYLDIQGFFLLNWNVLMKSSQEARSQRKSKKK